MPRQKEYDREKVLEKAMAVFWRKGFEGASIQDLVTATGLNRFGMYQSFGSKEGLFLEVLDKYREEVSAKRIMTLKEEPQGLGSIRKFFKCLVDDYCQARNTKGCLLTNTAIDCPSRGREALAKVKSHFNRMEEALFDCLLAAREQGEISAKADVRSLARYLLGVTQGISVMGRVYSDRESVDSLVEVTLKNLTLGA